MVSSYCYEDLGLIQRMCSLLRLSAGVTLLKARGAKPRQRKIYAFNDAENLDVKIMLLPALSGGVGITLTGANRMILLGADWDPANDAQLSRRCWRSGQQKPVIVWRIVTRGGLDARILERAQNKEELRKVVASGGTGGAAASAAVATKQHDLMSDLIYREAATTPANWVTVPSSSDVYTDTPTLAAAALSFDRKFIE